MPVFSDDEDDDGDVAASHAPPVAPIMRQQSVGAMFGRKNKNSLETTSSFGTGTVVEDAFASAIEISSREEFVPVSKTTVPDQIAAAHASSVVPASEISAVDEFDLDFSAGLSAAASSSTSAIESIQARVNEREAMSSIEPSAVAVDENPQPVVVSGGKPRAEKASSTARTEDFVDPLVDKCKWLMRGPKKTKKLSNVGVDFAQHVQKSGLAFVHALFAVPSNFPNIENIKTETSESGVRCFAPYELKSPILFFDAGVDAEGKLVNELIDEGDDVAVQIATSCIVVSKDVHDGAQNKRLVCAFLRLRLSDHPDDCSAQLLENWKVFKSRLPANNEILISIQRETAQKLCKHPVAKQHMCASVVKCFATSRVAKKKEILIFDYKRLDDDTKADVVVNVLSDKSDKKRLAAMETPTVVAKKPRGSKAASFGTVGEAGTPPSAAAARVPAGSYPGATATHPTEAPSAQTSLVVHDDDDVGAPSIWSNIVDKVSVVLPPFPHAPEFVHFPYDPSKVTLVPCGSSGFMLQFLA